MRALEVGSVCVKTTGREAGNRAVVIDTVDEKFVLIQGPRVRKRKCNILHLIPIGKKVNVTKSVTQKELEQMLSE
ncbi:MAG TPA: 50S ribosomal protein L14e [archaeon]|nr:50S ribosomal protein L14e [archaeon]